MLKIQKDLLTVKDTHIGKKLETSDLLVWISDTKKMLKLEKELIQIHKTSGFKEENEVELYTAIREKKRVGETHIGKSLGAEDLKTWVTKIEKAISLWKKIFVAANDFKFTPLQCREIYNSLKGIPKDFIERKKLEKLKETSIGKSLSLGELKKAVQIIKNLEIGEKESLDIENSKYSSSEIQKFFFESKILKNRFTTEEFNEFYKVVVAY